MAYIQEYLDFVQDTINLEYYNTQGLSMFELGNQRFIKSMCPTADGFTGKEHFTNKGFNHASVDLNGEDGALALDLRQPELFYEFRCKYDVVTNLGTTEHVEPIDKQYECFSIIHDVVKPNGIMIHLVPNARELEVSGAWFNHCNIYYTDEFFDALAKECNYTVLDSKKICGMNAVAFRKQTARAFTTNREIFNLIVAR